MIYRIALEADKHWGAMKVEDQYRSSYILKRYLAEFPIDLYINLGDFFDTKLLLNSKSSVYAIRDFTEKIQICAKRGIPVRAIKGTRGHDYDQWDAFDRLYQDESLDVKYFKTCTVEETLPGLNILYCPEENVNFADYKERYAEQLYDQPLNMAVLHGSFDTVMSSAMADLIENNSYGTTLMYRYDDMAPLVQGPLVAGHWHDGENHGHMYYVGSYDRWAFGEDNMKGFAIVEYDTDTKQYRYYKVANMLAGHFKTYEVYTSLYTDMASYKALAEAVRQTLDSDSHISVRILVKINEMLPDTQAQLDNLKFLFANERRVKFSIINQIHQKQKESHKAEMQKMETDYSFVRDRNMLLTAKIQYYIEKFYGRHYELSDIEEVIKPYVDIN